MESFEECYKRTQTEIRNFDFFKGLSQKGFSANLSVVMADEGPDHRHKSYLDKLRAAIKAAQRKKNKSEGDVIISGTRETSLFKRWFGGEVDTTNRSCAVKMLRHLYLVKARGGTDVWVYSPPKAYTEWMYDEMLGLDKTGLATWLSQTDEVYSKLDKKVMGEATQVALRWSMACIAELGKPSDKAKEIAARWFLDSGADDDKLNKTIKTLQAGFRKIVAVLNSHKLVLSDEPIDRDGGGWKDYAFVYKTEKMNVIYIQNATLEAAKGKMMWDAALTIVHELTHRELGTDDHRYGDDGGKLGPSAGVGALSERQAITNADNWGYFAADMNGAVPSGWRAYVSDGKTS